MIFTIERFLVRQRLIQPRQSSFEALKLVTDILDPELVELFPNHYYGLFVGRNRCHVRKEIVESLQYAAAQARQSQFGGIRVLRGYSHLHKAYEKGGVVDVTLVNGNGGEIDMGSEYLCPDPCQKTFGGPLDISARSKRKVLCEAMRTAGFVNHPDYWWQFHFAATQYGAWRLGKKTYSFGRVSPLVIQAFRA